MSNDDGFDPDEIGEGDWKIYLEKSPREHGRIDKPGLFPPPPAWRDFSERETSDTRAKNYKPSPHEVEMVNAALLLRRPLLITGNPGSGKSTLARAVSWQLGLGDVLWWPINSRSTLQEGLYDYDALGRLRDLNIEKLQREQTGKSRSKAAQRWDEQIGRYIRLGALGTAFYTQNSRPRVLLIDEIDKSDIDLPNDLLHVLEEGVFEIPELQRLVGSQESGNEKAAAKKAAAKRGAKKGKKKTAKKTPTAGRKEDKQIVNVLTHRSAKTVPVENGTVRCRKFPFVVLTSNGERELPPAFKRRCLCLNIEDPKGDRLKQIVQAHIKEANLEDTDILKQIQRFEQTRDEGALLATDQLLNAIFLITRDRQAGSEERKRILDVVLQALGRK